ncbi:pIIIa protein precursor [Equine adenovirus 1]|uniref:Pre-hexon-linking protein IIIa n=1 Tax=Equine adenovirus A serotype 1 TaxID=46916 RepID=G5CZ81_ADEE1|nr:precursor protein [Equine adenovirus 1]AEP16412.1 precursor protein [Equine adenovirus 1]ANG08557.1 pIIIa protein precursor [Equine adenovirus 1]
MSVAVNPEKVAALQTQSSADDSWGASIKRIMALTAGQGRAFSAQPLANRMDAILEAVVPSRKDPTHERVLTIVNALIANGAIRRDEAAGVYDALLRRVAKYNSMNAQSNLERLAGDVREAVAQKVRIADGNLGSLAALNAFLARIPANVERGQENYMGFISALKLLVTEVPSTEVYQAGPHYFLQSSRSGTQTVNLTAAFENLKSLWGVRAPTMERLSISALLTPNTRLLLLLVAPFTDSVSVSRDSYIGYLLTLYREALGRNNLDEATFNEVTAVSRAIGDQDATNLQATLNFLLTNRRKTAPREFFLTPEEERILRFVQQAVSLRMMQDNLGASEALDATSANLEPTFYASNMAFINKLMDYFHRAAVTAPDYFMNAVLNPRWLPPEGFYTGDFDFPQRDDDYLWDETDTSLRDDFGAVAAASARLQEELANKFLDEDQRSAGPSSASASAFASRLSSPLSSRRSSRRSSLSQTDFLSLVNRETKPKNMIREIDRLTEKLNRWKSYRREVAEQESPTAVQPASRQRYRDRSPFATDESDDGMSAPDRFLRFEGSGNPFAHLRPQRGRGRL